MGVDFSSILFTPVAPCCVACGVFRVLPVPLGEFGGGHVLRGRYSVMVVVFKCRIQRLFGFMDVGKFP